MNIDKHIRALFYHLMTTKDLRAEVITPKNRFLRFSNSGRQSIEDTTRAHLTNLIQHARTNCPYYSQVFRETGFDLQGDDIYQILKSLPILTKEIIEQNREQMISRLHRRGDIVTSYTGGSSGTPTSFYQDMKCRVQRIGRQLGILQRCGYDVGDRCGLVWGAHQDLANDNRAGFLKRKVHELARSKKVLDCQLMDEDQLMDYYHQLKDYNPSVLYGYPYALCAFAEFIGRHDLQPIRVKTIMCTAERMSTSQRKLLQDTFGGEVFNLYCTREHGCVAFECPEHKGMHIDAGSVYIEIVPDDPGNPNAEAGKIVVTDLLNHGMPFIRYAIGDRGALSTGECPCGCKLPLLSRLEGRVSQLLYRPDGRIVAGLMLIDIFMDTPEIDKVQIIQKTLTDVDVNLIPREGYAEPTEAWAISELKKHMGDGVNIAINLVNDIPVNEHSGKFPEVVCLIK